MHYKSCKMEGKQTRIGNSEREREMRRRERRGEGKERRGKKGIGKEKKGRERKRSKTDERN